MTRYDLAGRTSSTGGLGAALAQALRARGAKLALLDLNAEASSAQAQTLGGATVARGWRADVRDLTSSTPPWPRPPSTSDASTW